MEKGHDGEATAEHEGTGVDEESEHLGGTPFDILGAELGHREDRCSFESLLLAHGLTDPALHELAEVVHEADVDDDQFHTLEAAGLDAVIRGLGMVARDDLELFETTHRLFDGLYAWFSRGTT
jgi:hypothetical protein